MRSSTSAVSAGTVADMKRSSRAIESLPPALRELVERGHAAAPQRELAEVLAEIGRPPGAVSDAGTRALAEQRGERG